MNKKIVILCGVILGWQTLIMSLSERTFAMIKPHAVAENKTDEIIDMIKKAGFTVVALKKIMLNDKLMAQLYKEFRFRLWFRTYIKSMSHKLAVVMVLEKDHAIKAWNKTKMDIRKYFSLLFTHKNAVHGSENHRDARRDIALFFPELSLKNK